MNLKSTGLKLPTQFTLTKKKIHKTTTTPKGGIGRSQRSDGTYLRDFVDHLGHNGQATHKDACSHKGA